MTSHEDVELAFLSALINQDFASEDATQIVRNYKTFVETRPKPETPQPEPEPKTNWFERHSDALIKGAFALAGVVMIVGGEKLGNHIYTTKAWNHIPK